jgi:hypothetical protein
MRRYFIKTDKKPKPPMPEAPAPASFGRGTANVSHNVISQGSFCDNGHWAIRISQEVEPPAVSCRSRPQSEIRGVVVAANTFLDDTQNRKQFLSGTEGLIQ